jgi:hypothetical protein
VLILKKFANFVFLIKIQLIVTIIAGNKVKVNMELY